MDSSPWKELVSDLVPMIVSVVGLLISWALLELKNYLKSKIKNDAAVTALNAVDNIVQTVVTDIGATLKSEFEKARADGKITIEEGKIIKQHALDRINVLVPADMRKSLSPLVANFEAYINSRIEAVVECNKGG